METLRDPVWQAVGVLLALVSILLAYWIYARQSRYKELSSGSIAIRPLIQVSDDIAHRVVVTVDSKPVDKVFMVVYAIKNSGTLPILETDYVRPVRIEFSPTCKVLSAHIAEERPQGIGATLEILDHSLILAPLMLNPLDVIEIQVLVSGNDAKPVLDARLIDVPEVHSILMGTNSKVPKFLVVMRTIIVISSVLISIPIFADYQQVVAMIPNQPLVGYFALATFLIFDVMITYTLLHTLRGKFGRAARRQIKDA